MKRIIIIIAAASLFTACRQPVTTVHLKGRMNVDPPVILAYNGAASMLGDSRDILIHTGKDGSFDTTITLDEPGYYSIRRNTLYLTPGDDMEMYITEWNTEATFKGEGGAINEYMKYRLFPKGGSFLDAGKNIRSSFVATKAVIDSLAALRRAELEALTDASPEFKALEQVRIDADIVNSCFAYINYSKYYNSMTSREEYDRQVAMAIDSIAPVVKPLIQKFNDDKYLDVAVVRDVFWYVTNDTHKKCFDGVTDSERRKELYNTAKYISKLRMDVTPEKIAECTNVAGQLKNEDFKTEFLHKIAQASVLLPGKPAIDFEMETADGQKMMLSSFKGKVLYIDLWATWCGPCKQESPYFNQLAKTFGGKDILFLKISTDKQRSDWTKYLEHDDSGLTQYISTDQRLTNDWAVFYIPRFLLIDKEFNIINAYANRPSEEGIAGILNSALR